MAWGNLTPMAWGNPQDRMRKRGELGASSGHLDPDARGGDPRGVGELAATGYAFVLHGLACLVCCLEAC